MSDIVDSTAMKQEVNALWESIAAKAEKRLVQEFRNNMDAARVLMDVPSSFQPMMECLYRANAIAMFLGSIKR